jgi:hypothetical protein
VDLLRGRIGTKPPPAQGPHVGAARPDADRDRVGKRSGRVSVAGLVCVKPGRRTRLIYRTITHHGRKNEQKGFRVHDFKRLLEAAHQQLHGPHSHLRSYRHKARRGAGRGIHPGTRVSRRPTIRPASRTSSGADGAGCRFSKSSALLSELPCTGPSLRRRAAPMGRGWHSGALVRSSPCFGSPWLSNLVW